MRCQERLQLGHADLPYMTRHPILLNPKHHLTELHDCEAPIPTLYEFRVRDMPPFASTVVDFAGPLHLHNSEEKVWFCLFTCCAIYPCCTVRDCIGIVYSDIYYAVLEDLQLTEDFPKEL